MRRLHRANLGGIKLIDFMVETSELNSLIIFQLYNYRVFNSAIHSHTIFECDDRYGEQVGYELWVVVNFKVGVNI